MTGVRHWGGSYPRPVVVERCYRLPETIAEWPWLGVFRAPAAAYAEKAFVGHHEDRFAIQIVGICGGDRDGSTIPATWAERLHYDMRLTLVAAQTLGLKTRSIEWGQEDVDENALQLTALASFVQTLTLIIDDVIPVE